MTGCAGEHDSDDTSDCCVRLLVGKAQRASDPSFWKLVLCQWSMTRVNSAWLHWCSLSLELNVYVQSILWLDRWDTWLFTFCFAVCLKLQITLCPKSENTRAQKYCGEEEIKSRTEDSARERRKGENPCAEYCSAKPSDWPGLQGGRWLFLLNQWHSGNFTRCQLIPPYEVLLIGCHR